MIPFALPVFLENARDLEIIGVVLGIVFWFQMLRHCARFEPGTAARWSWLAFMIVVPGLGSLVYFLARVVRPRP